MFHTKIQLNSIVTPNIDLIVKSMYVCIVRLIKKRLPTYYVYSYFC